VDTVAEMANPHVLSLSLSSESPQGWTISDLLIAYLARVLHGRLGTLVGDIKGIDCRIDRRFARGW